MDIRNFTQFINLLILKNVVNTNPAFIRLATCVNVYNSICECGGNSSKQKSDKACECNRIYRESIGAVDSIKPHLFNGCKDTSISFYMDNKSHLKTISR